MDTQDMITSCTSGRNFTLARTFASRPSSTLAQLEIELLAGQKLQGTGTAAEVYAFLERSGDLDKFPLFRTVHRIASGEWEAGRLLEEIAAV